MNNCPNCGKPLDESNVLKCPHCQIDVPTFIRINLENLKKGQDFLAGYKKELDSEVDKKLSLRVRRYVLFLFAFCLVALTIVYLGSRSLANAVISAQLAQRLAQPDFQEVLTDSAKQKSGELIRRELLPQIEAARLEASREFGVFKAYLDDCKAKLGADYETIAKELEMVRSRNRLAQLANAAISDGKRQALEELKKYASIEPRDDLAEVARAEISRVEAFYATTNRMKEEPVTYSSTEGIVIVDDKIPTSTLIAELGSNPDWRVRAKFAQLLSGRKDAGVPQALLEVASKDERLDVVKAALDSFQNLTGYKGGIFDYQSAGEWLQKDTRR